MHRPSKRLLLSIVAVPAVVVGLVAASALAASAHRTAAPPANQLAALKRQNAKLKAANARLQAYTPAGIARQLAAAKSALDEYQSVDAAKADGYQPASPCEFFPDGAGNASSDQGGMGVHFVNGAIMAAGKIDPKRPPILVYQPVNGGFQLVAAEYSKPDADQDLSTDGDRPSLFGRAFDGPMLGHAPGMPKHYDLHVWLWKRNPSGMFAPWNPDVTCG